MNWVAWLAALWESWMVQPRDDLMVAWLAALWGFWMVLARDGSMVDQMVAGLEV